MTNKLRDIAPWIIISCVVLTFGLSIYRNFFYVPESDGQYYEMIMDKLDKNHNEIQDLINQKTNQILQRNERITKDSLIIINSDRAYRDSLRAIYNPSR